MVVGADFQREPEGRGGRLDSEANPVFAGLGQDEAFGRKVAGGAGDFAGERVGVFRVVERGVVDGEPARQQGLAVVAHGSQKDRDARLGGGHVLGFLRDFRHPDRIDDGIKVVEGGGVGVELVAKNQDERAHEGFKMGVRCGGGRQRKRRGPTVTTTFTLSSGMGGKSRF